ncbi:hypothetical protein [Zobellia galactanivorans]|uniref:Sheath polysaccharide lyase n=1 Tax=Zobellia galactanivorans (strain DSM 12802 / CCUG 47099 / CIP 106680 / NCIMB 13871 / Dsij) TaxID=63186 RepID=G0L022_ZOBGA|nr:hypothetical protein [Zobellia galactanivorans]CAZ97322.1 Sheath polysaccharide lyase [Zobellia galactanivorans]
MKYALKELTYIFFLIFCIACSKDEEDHAQEIDSPDISTGSIKICEAKGNGKLYEVGPGKEYENIIDVPTENLGPGDAVRIYAKDKPYYERIIISTRGTETEPICVCGVPDENGKLPVLDGTNSRVRPIDLRSYFNSTIAYLGMVIISATSDNHPEYINISNLQIQGAHQYKEDDSQKTYEMGSEKLKPFSRAASGIYMRGAHIEVNNCIITHNGNGIFGAYNSPKDPLIDVRLNNNIIKGNGTFNVSQQHNIYIEADGLVSIGNQFGPVREGSHGANYKSRSAGDVIMYNRFVGPAARQINLAETENAVDYFPQLDSFKTTYFAGNIIEGSNPGAGTILHYGNDVDSASPDGKGNRKGTLYCYNNTFVLKGNNKVSYRKMFFDLTFCEGSLEAFNNILYYENDGSDPNIQVSVLRNSGSVDLFSNNLISDATVAAYSTRFTGEDQKRCSSGSLSYETVAQMIVPDQDFSVDPANAYQLQTGSKAIDSGMEIPAYVKKLEYQFKSPNGVEPREIKGKSIDIGAYEF